MSSRAKAYLIIQVPSTGNPGLDSQPLNITASGVIIDADNTTFQSINTTANFSYGDSDESIREALVDYLNSNLPAGYGTSADVTFL